MLKELFVLGYCWYAKGYLELIGGFREYLWSIFELMFGIVIGFGMIRPGLF